VEQVWRLDLAALRWEAMPSLEDASRDQACVVRDNLVIIGGEMMQAVLGGPRYRQSLEV